MLTSDEKNRIQFIIDMSGNNVPAHEEHRPFFVAFGHMLRPKFVFISEQRRFPDFNDLEKMPLREDGSNIHSFLFWLKNGDRSKQGSICSNPGQIQKISMVGTTCRFWSQ